jgi:hypothetical protein
VCEEVNGMAKKWSVTCPCGFAFSTPHGEDDAVAVVQLHVKRIHNQDVSKQEAVKSIKVEG